MKCPNCDVDLIEYHDHGADVIKCPKCPYNILKDEKEIKTLYILFGIDVNGVENLMALPCGSGGHQTIIHADYDNVVKAYHRALKLMPNTRFIIKQFKYSNTLDDSHQK